AAPDQACSPMVRAILQTEALNALDGLPAQSDCPASASSYCIILNNSAVRYEAVYYDVAGAGTLTAAQCSGGGPPGWRKRIHITSPPAVPPKNDCRLSPFNFVQ